MQGVSLGMHHSGIPSQASLPRCDELMEYSEIIHILKQTNWNKGQYQTNYKQNLKACVERTENGAITLTRNL